MASCTKFLLYLMELVCSGQIGYFPVNFFVSPTPPVRWRVHYSNSYEATVFSFITIFFAHDHALNRGFVLHSQYKSMK